MLYAMRLGDCSTSIEFSDEMNSQDLELVKEMLCRAIENRQNELKKVEANTLTLEDSIRSLYPPLSGRTQNCLLRDGKKTIGDVLKLTKTDLLSVRNLGKKGAEEVIERFSKYGNFKE